MSENTVSLILIVAGALIITVVVSPLLALGVFLISVGMGIQAHMASKDYTNVSIKVHEREEH